MDPQRPIFPQRVPKKSWADLMHLAHFAKSKPRDYQKWIRDVRFTPRGSEKKEHWADLTHLAHFADLGDFAHMADVLNITSPAEGVPA